MFLYQRKHTVSETKYYVDDDDYDSDNDPSEPGNTTRLIRLERLIGVDKPFLSFFSGFFLEAASDAEASSKFLENMMQCVAF